MNLKLAIIIPLILILLISTVPASSAFHPEHESWLGSQHYIDRYNNEENYRKWFGTYYGSNYTSIYEAVGVQEPWHLTEIRNQKEMILAQVQVLQQILDQLQDQSKLIRALNATVSNMAQEPGSQAAQSHNYPEWSDPVIVAEKKKLHKEIFSYKDEFDSLSSQTDGYSWDWNFSEPHIGDTAFTVTTLEMYKMSVNDVQNRIDGMKQEILDYEEKRKHDEKMRIEDEEIEEFLRIEKAQKLKEEKQQKEIDVPRQEWSDYQNKIIATITSPQHHLYKESPLDYGLPPNPFSPIHTYPENYTHEEVVQFYKDMANFQKKMWEMIQAQDPIVGAKPSSD